MQIASKEISEVAGKEGNEMYLLLGIIFIVIGLVMVSNPDLFCDITEGWKNSSGIAVCFMV